MGPCCIRHKSRKRFQRQSIIQKNLYQRVKGIITMSSATRAQKRTGSSPDNPTAQPENKRAKISAPPPKQYVYIVLHDITMAYGGESTTDICGVYASLEDANNCIKKVVDEEY